MFVSSFLNRVCFRSFLIDTQQLLICDTRSNGPKKILTFIGALCFCLVICLFLLINSGASEIEEYQDHHKRSINEFDSRAIKALKNYKNAIEMKTNQKSEIKVSRRRRRQTFLDPVDVEMHERNIRIKRLNQQLEEMKMKFEKCNRFEMMKSECDQFDAEILALQAALTQQLKTIDELEKSLQLLESRNVSSGHKLKQWTNPARQPLNELNQENKVAHKVEEFSSIPRFHEEMDNSRVNPWNSVNEMSEIPQEAPRPPTPAARANPQSNNLQENDKIIPLKSSGKNINILS